MGMVDQAVINFACYEDAKDFLGLASGCDWLEKSGHYGYKLRPSPVLALPATWRRRSSAI